MTTRKTTFATVAAVALIGLGVLAGSSIGGSSTSPTSGGYIDAGKVDLELAPGGGAKAQASGKKKAKVSNLITTNLVNVPANSSLFATVSCGKFGIPVSGGGVLPASAGLNFDVISKFDPNTFVQEGKGKYNIGVRNESDGQQSFYATVTCMKGVKGN